MYYYGYDNLFTIMLLILGSVVVLVAQARINSAYRKYRIIKNKKNLTGADVAHEILNANGLSDIYVVATNGELTDNYDPSKKVLHLSRDIFEGDSIASMAVAAHECGHAIQDKVGYTPMKIRSALVPVVNFVTYMGYFVIIIALIAGYTGYIIYGLLTLAAALLFQLVTLPVEYNASNRAKAELVKLGLVDSAQQEDVSDMLHAAALTYVASVISTLLNFLRLIILLGDRDDRR